jgi:hypothetical protein
MGQELRTFRGRVEDPKFYHHWIAKYEVLNVEYAFMKA